MTGPAGYDSFVGGSPPAGFPTDAELGELLRTLRGYRRALQAQCDDARDCRSAEPDAEISNQMEETAQNLAGALYKLDKAIPALESVQANLKQYPDVVLRMVDVVEQVRARGSDD